MEPHGSLLQVWMAPVIASHQPEAAQLLPQPPGEVPQRKLLEHNFWHGRGFEPSTGLCLRRVWLPSSLQLGHTRCETFVIGLGYFSCNFLSSDRIWTHRPNDYEIPSLKFRLKIFLIMRLYFWTKAPLFYAIWIIGHSIWTKYQVILLRTNH